MLKKGQAGWIDNSRRVAPVVSPILSHICDKNGEMISVVRWPSRKLGKKKFGVLERWIGTGRLYRASEWKHWYRTARDRDEGMIALQKSSWAHKKTFETIER